MELIDPRSGQVVWADSWGAPMPPPRADGLAYIERGARTDRTVPPEDINALAMIGRETGITPRLNALNQMLNPVNSLYEAGQHSKNMLAPGRTGWERVGDLGGMLSGMAGTVAPMFAASKGAIPAADAVMEGMAGATLMPRAMAKDFAADEFGGVKLLGGKDADLTNVEWVFKGTKKPDLTAAENKIYGEAGMTGKTEVLPIRSMYATQGKVNPDFGVTETSSGMLPKVIRKNGEFFVMDGHHRITKVADEGGQNVRVQLFDFDRQDTSAPLLDYDPLAAEKSRKEIEKILADLGL